MVWRQSERCASQYYHGFDQDVFGHGDGLMLGFEGLLEGIEALRDFPIEQPKHVGGEPMTETVAAGCFFAGFTLGSGGLLCILAIS